MLHTHILPPTITIRHVWSVLNNNSSAVAEMGDRLATIDMGRKVGAAVPPFYWGELDPHVTQCGLGLSPYQVAS